MAVSDKLPGWIGSARKSVDLDISSTDQTLAEVPDGFHCNTSGNLVCRLQKDGTDHTFAVVSGVFYPYRVVKVVKASTTAAGVFLYAGIS